MDDDEGTSLTQKINKYNAQKDGIRAYKTSLNALCQKKYLSKSKYVPPASNVYKNYEDVADYKNRVLGNVPEKTHVDRNCKHIRHTLFKKSHDQRYFVNVTDIGECAHAKGIWDPTAISRENKYDHGVCWANDQSNKCGKAVDANMLRPFPRKESDVRYAEDKCSKQGCRLDFLNPKRSRYTYDCMPATDIPIPKEPERKIPLDNIEQFMYDWYHQNIKEYAPPPTTQLIGVGNRCIVKDEKQSSSSSTSTPNPPPGRVAYYNKKYTDFKKLDPTKKEDMILLKDYLTPSAFDEYKRLWKRHQAIIKKYGYERYQQMYKLSKDPFTAFHNARDKNMMEQDGPTVDYLEASSASEATDTQLVAKGLAPSVPQSVVNTIMKYVAVTNNPKRGMIAWHSTGSGKTCTSAGVIDAFWDTNREIIFATSIDALASNPEYKFHECSKNLYPRWRKNTVQDVGAQYKQRGVRFLSFAKLSNRVQNYKTNPNDKDPQRIVNLDNAILIIDEVHNLFRPLPTQQKEYKRLEEELTDPNKHKGLKVVILTATPGDTPADIVKLLNIVRTPSDPLITIPDSNNKESLSIFIKSIRGLVSYFDMSSDNTKFPSVLEPKEFIRVPMSNAQFKKYIEAYKSVKTHQTDYDELAKNNQLSKYWEPARKYANMIFNFDKDMALSDFSAKLPVLLSQIAKFPLEKHYVYSSFYTKLGYGGQGIVGIAKQMDVAGYEKMSVADAQKFNKSGNLPPKGVKRYALAITSEVGKHLDDILRIYNHPDNKYGEIIHVLLASQTYNEGIDLKAVRHIHYFEPLITMASDKQTLGRAARYCSHADLDRDAGEWNVKLHRYITDKPLVTGLSLEEATKLVDAKELQLKQNPKNKILKKELTDLKKQQKEAKRHDVTNIQNIEEKIFEESRERVKDILTMYVCMKEAAVDCRVLQKFHALTGIDIKCAEFKNMSY